MKSSEIRIGNLLTKNGNIIEVKGISPHCGDYAIYTEDSWVYLKNCEPVLLSEKWLLKFGYLPDYFVENRFYIKCHEIWKYNDQFVCDKIEVQIFYIHQLQNLYFALTGEELILKQ